MRNISRFIFTTFLIFLLVFSCISCTSNEDIKTNKLDVDIWVESSTAKIFQNIEVEDKSNKVMNITMARNEYEGASLMFNAKEDINEYYVSVSDLVCGKYAITNENIAIYNIKYIDSIGINTVYYNNSLPSGSKMPDALLPFDVAIEYGENNAKAGNNQGIYFEFFSPKDIPGGVYRGTITLTIEETEFKVPVIINIANFVIPDTSSVQSNFCRWGRTHYASAELDSSDEFDELLFQNQMKYRMGGNLPFEGAGGVEKYVELVRKYHEAPGFSGYRLYYKAVSSTYKGYKIGFDVADQMEYLKAIAIASAEDRIDYFDGCSFYYSTIADEPDVNQYVTWDTVRNLSEVVQLMLYDTAKELDYLLIDYPNYDFYLSNIRESLLGIPNVMPGGFNIKTLENNGCDYIAACSVLNLFDNETQREEYQRTNGVQTWAYTCIGPQYPYPNLLANSWVVACRVINWMLKAYNIDGFLVWDVYNYTTGDNFSRPVINNFDYLSDTMTGVSDGKIFYPGKPYGIEGPIPSLRAVSYRDGAEDYELLTMIYDKYIEEGLNPDNALSDLYDKIFSGAIYTEDHNIFDEVRLEMFELLDNTYSDWSILYKSVFVEDDDITIDIKIPNQEASLKINDIEQEKTLTGDYSFTTKTSESNILKFEIIANGVSKIIYKRISGKYNLLCDFNESNQTLVRVNGTSSKEMDNTAGLNESGALKVSFVGKLNEATGIPDVSYSPWFAINLSNYPVEIEEIESIILWVYNPSDENEIRVVVRNGKETLVDHQLSTIIVHEGWNYVEIEVPKYARQLENVTAFYFYGENRTTENADGTYVVDSYDLYIDNVAYRTLG